jgi:WD40 repeat protein
MAFAQQDFNQLAVGQPIRVDAMTFKGGEVRLLDLRTGKARTIFTDPQELPRGLALSPDGKTLAVGMEKRVVLCDTTTGTTRLDRPLWFSNFLALSPDGSLLAVPGGKGIVLIETNTGRTRGEFAIRNARSSPTNVAFAPNGRLVAGTTGAAVQLWDVASGKETAFFKGPAHAITGLAFSPDGSRLVAAAEKAGEVRVWEIATPLGPEIVNLGQLFHPKPGFSADGKSLTIRDGDDINSAIRRYREMPERPDHDLCFEAEPLLPGRRHTLQRLFVTAAPPTSALAGHSLNLRRAAFVFQCKLLAVVGDRQAKAIELWDAATGQLFKALPHDAPCYAVASSPDGQVLAALGHDLTVTLWNTGTWTRRAVLRGHAASIDALAFSADGAILATDGADGTVKLWDVADGKERAALPRHPRKLDVLLFAPNGRVLVTGWNQPRGMTGLKIWDVATAGEVGTLQGCQAGFATTAFSNDSKHLAIVAQDYAAKRFEVKLCDGRTGAELATIAAHSDWITCVAFAPDGKALATGSADRTVRIWDVPTGKPRASLTGPGGVQCLAFAADGKTLVAGGGGDTRVWDTVGYKERAVLANGKQAGVLQVALAPDGQTLITVGQDPRVVKAWDLRNGSERATISLKAIGRLATPQFAADSLTLLTDDTRVRLWDTTTWKERAIVAANAQEARALVLAATPDNGTLLSSRERTATVWDAAGRKPRATIAGFGTDVRRAAFTADGRLVATGHADGSINIWDALNGKLRVTLPTDAKDEVSAVVFSPDGGVVASAARNTVHVWDAATGAAMMSFKLPETSRGGINRLALTAHGRLLVIVEGNNTVRLWDRVAGQERALRQEPGTERMRWGLDAIAFAPDGRTLATGLDGGVKLWDTATGLERLTLWATGKEITSLAFSVDGKTLAAATDNELRLFHAANEAEVLQQTRVK